MRMCILWAFLMPIFAVCNSLAAGGVVNRSFQIDYINNQFLKDGKPFQYISGSIHYYRSTEQQWDSLLKKCHLGGLNTISTNILWNMHQKSADQFNFSGNRNVFKFIELAKKNDLLVILKIGPYVDSDRTMGGLPRWLLWAQPGVKLRSSDPEFLKYVANWFDVLLPKLRPYLYENGGPVILMQIENDYGSYGCDKAYLSSLHALVRRNLGQNLALFTTSGPKLKNLECESVDGVYSTVGFGPDSAKVMNGFFANMRQVSPNGPLVNSEFYAGWVDHWQTSHINVSAEVVAHALDSLLGEGASVNIYMYHGGTNFAYGNGAVIYNGTYLPVTTSYDFDAPLSEAGDPTDKYFAIKAVIQKHFEVPSQAPTSFPKLANARVYLKTLTSIHWYYDSFLPLVGNQLQQSLLPMSYEELHQARGFVIYTVKVPFIPSDPVVFNATELKGRGYIFVNHTLQGIISRQENITAVPIRVRQNDTISMIMEDPGRVCYGEYLGESIGLGKYVTLGGKQLLNWNQVAVQGISDETLLVDENSFPSPSPVEILISVRNGGGGGVMYVGNFTVNKSKTVADTFIRFDGFSKGVIWVNGFNLGRYWPAGGPQVTLFLPGSLLKPNPEVNQFILFELEGTPESCYVPKQLMKLQNQGDCFISLTDTPELNAPTAFPAPELPFSAKLN